MLLLHVLSVKNSVTKIYNIPFPDERIRPTIKVFWGSGFPRTPSSSIRHSLPYNETTPLNAFPSENPGYVYMSLLVTDHWQKTAFDFLCVLGRPTGMSGGLNKRCRTFWQTFDSPGDSDVNNICEIPILWQKVTLLPITNTDTVFENYRQYQYQYFCDNIFTVYYMQRRSFFSWSSVNKVNRMIVVEKWQNDDSWHWHEVNE